MTIIIKPPLPLPEKRVKNKNGDFVVPKSVFLAGTIDMGNSIDWQFEASGQLDCLYIFNPRRSDWNKDWFQSKENNVFSGQCHWEMNALSAAEIIFMNLLEDSQSPISLLELGLYANSSKMVVCCPDKFWRKGNVEIVCEKYNIPCVTNFDQAIYIVNCKLRGGL